MALDPIDTTYTSPLQLMSGAQKLKFFAAIFCRIRTLIV